MAGIINTRKLRIKKYVENFPLREAKVLLPEQIKVITDFDKQNSLNDISVTTRKNYLDTLKGLAKTIKKPFEKMTREDLEIFVDNINKRTSPSTAKQKKIQTRRFFKFVYDTDDYPDVVKWISTKKSKRHKESARKLLTLEERKAMLNACKSQRDRAIISFLDVTGCRAEELILTGINDVILDKRGQFMTIELGKGKTGRRRIVVTDGIGEIQLWINMSPKKDDPDAPLFVSFSNNNRFKVLDSGALCRMIATIAENAGIDRRVHPHLFRHTRVWICKKVKGWREDQMRVFFGWSKTSIMPAWYGSLDEDDVNELILQEAGLNQEKNLEDAEIRDRICPRCHSKNPFDAKYCNTCSLALDSKIAEKHNKIINVSDDIMDLSYSVILKLASITN